MTFRNLSLRDWCWLVLVLGVVVFANAPRHETKGIYTAGFPVPFAIWWSWAGERTFDFQAFVVDALIGGIVITVLAVALPWSRRTSIPSAK